MATAQVDRNFERASYPTPSQQNLKRAILSGEGASFDERLFLKIYGTNGRPMKISMRVADRSSYPVFIASVPAYWVSSQAGDAVSTSDAAIFTAAWISTAATSLILKRTFKRRRPFVSMDDVSRRLSLGHSGIGEQSSMPSGHAAMSAVVAASLSYDYPRWYVIGPSVAWASLVGTSRIWKGVHYPSDVLAGALLGTAVASVSQFLK